MWYYGIYGPGIVDRSKILRVCNRYMVHGVILYTMLNGMLPFDDDDEMKIQHKVINTEPMFYDHVPIDVNQLISKCY